jgi:hypothetical protein
MNEKQREHSLVSDVPADEHESPSMAVFRQRLVSVMHVTGLLYLMMYLCAFIAYAFV